MARRKIATVSPLNSGLDMASLLLRLVFGMSMVYGHGWGKLMKFFGEGEITFSDPLGIGEIPTLVMAVFSEVICAVLITLGLFTRWALIPLIATMVVALFIVHIEDPFTKMEKSLLFLAGYIAIFLLGSGRYSLDHFLKK
jgi:putative oxidoreductase